MGAGLLSELMLFIKYIFYLSYPQSYFTQAPRAFSPLFVLNSTIRLTDLYYSKGKRERWCFQESRWGRVRAIALIINFGRAQQGNFKSFKLLLCLPQNWRHRSKKSTPIIYCQDGMQIRRVISIKSIFLAFIDSSLPYLTPTQWHANSQTQRKQPNSKMIAIKYFTTKLQAARINCVLERVHHAALISLQFIKSDVWRKTVMAERKQLVMVINDFSHQQIFSQKPQKKAPGKRKTEYGLMSTVERLKTDLDLPRKFWTFFLYKFIQPPWLPTANNSQPPPTVFWW